MPWIRKSVQSFWTLTPSRTNPMVQTKFGGTVRGESAMANTSDVGSLVEFTFNVSHLHHSDHIRPPRCYIVSTICVLLSHISLVSTLSLTLQLLFCGSSILLGEEIVMWAMVYGVSMTGVDAILELQSSPVCYLRRLPIFPFFLLLNCFTIRCNWAGHPWETWGPWLWSLNGPSRCPTASGCCTWRRLWSLENLRQNVILLEKLSTRSTSL